jgi:hypothetical protein
MARMRLTVSPNKCEGWVINGGGQDGSYRTKKEALDNAVSTAPSKGNAPGRHQGPRRRDPVRAHLRQRPASDEGLNQRSAPHRVERCAGTE